MKRVLPWEGKPRVCPLCGGKGVTRSIIASECMRCGGTGIIEGQKPREGE